MMQGIRRGLYSNEAGIGSAPNASASAQVSHPIKQGLVQMLSVFIDTLLLCTATAMMCLSSGIAPAQELQGAPWVQAALHESLGNFGPLFITVAMVLFAFTTLLGNCFYCDNLLNYIHKGQPSKTFMKGFSYSICTGCVHWCRNGSFYALEYFRCFDGSYGTDQYSSDLDFVKYSTESIGGL